MTRAPLWHADVQLKCPDWVDTPGRARGSGTRSCGCWAYAVQQIHIWQIVDGKIVEHWAARDDLGLREQLGLLDTQQQPETRS